MMMMVVVAVLIVDGADGPVVELLLVERLDGLQDDGVGGGMRRRRFHFFLFDDGVGGVPDHVAAVARPHHVQHDEAGD